MSFLSSKACKPALVTKNKIETQDMSIIWSLSSFIVIRPLDSTYGYMCNNVYRFNFDFIYLFLRTHQPDSRVEMSDLTWEQKEQVLRLLFAKMNGQKER